MFVVDLPSGQQCLLPMEEMGDKNDDEIKVYGPVTTGKSW